MVTAMRAAASHVQATHARTTWSAGGTAMRAPPPLVRVPRRPPSRGSLCACRRAALAVGLGPPASSGLHAERGSRQPMRALSGMGNVEDGEGLGALDDKTLRELRRLEGLAEPILELRSSARSESLKANIEGVTTWKDSLARGLLPADDTEWPDETFRTALLETLKELDMARFTRKHKPVTDTLLRNILEMLHEYEDEMADAPSEGDGEDSQDAGGQQQQPQMNQPGQSDDGGDDGDDGDAGEGDAGGGGADGSGGGEGESSVEDMQMSLEDNSSDSGDNGDSPGKGQNDKAKEIVEKLMEEFKEQWEPAVENLEAADQAFAGLDNLMDGPTGFDVSQGLWAQRGWKELDALRKKLAELKELRDLVRELGRGSGKGPLKRARAHVDQAARPMGVTRSPLQPSETRGLTRSGDLSSMLPSEATLMAGPGRSRLLVKQRLAERTLLTYERTGWNEEPTRILERTEVRPSATRGPIIVCLDTSGSMMGARETVAKAMTLECLRQAHSQKRACYVYAFSGPGAVEEMELAVDAQSMTKLLQFLTMSFNGGTDADEPLWRSLARLRDDQWADADILMVTDGEIRPPSSDLIDSLTQAKSELGLKVHGLLVGDRGDPDVMDAICDQTHSFRAWDKVDGRPPSHSTRF